jgi:hypothetical protein
MSKLVGFGFLFLSTCVYSDSTSQPHQAQAVISGHVSAVSTVSVSRHNDLTFNKPLSDTELLSFDVNNNDKDGFVVTIESENSWSFVGDTSEPPIKYDVSFSSGSGVLGATEPRLPNREKLTNDPIVLVFDAPRHATVDKRYVMSVTTTDVAKNKESVFRDTVTVLISSL